MKKTTIIYLILIATAISLHAQSIVNTKHNLSVDGRGTIKSDKEDEICLFCHTPHNSSASGPLWNRKDPGQIYSTYKSSTMQAQPGQPDGSSILCLSCHDGTIALGSVLSQQTPISFSQVTTMPLGRSNLSTNLQNDHPISFSYNSALANADGELKSPESILKPISFENKKLQCTSCHDPHKNIYDNFLVASTQYSDLCNQCHQKNAWSSSSHSTSEKTWNSVLPNPWQHTTWTTVAQNACENCHSPHNAGGTPRLMNYQAEEANCLNCHNGNVAAKNVQAEFLKTYSHNVEVYSGVHEPNENSNTQAKHVECSDCHNPHATNATTATAPAVSGSLIGVKGISQSGIAINSANYEYEICYKCHSDKPATGSSTARKIIQNNTRLEFASTNPSYHPIVAAGKNTNIDGLITPMTASSVIYCSDCHASSGTGASQGPHGSIYPQILKYNYDRSDTYVATYSAYELCYKCHDQNTNYNNHALIKNSHAKMTSCNTCHDPHGISGTQGTSANNSFLINFSQAVVSNNSNGQLQWEYVSDNHGKCNLTCHSHNHVNAAY